MLFFLLPSLPAYFLITTRGFSDQYIPLEISSGTVVSKYRSMNHQYPVVVIQNREGNQLEMEAIPEDTWAALEVGDHVRKEPLSTYLVRANEFLPVVEPSPLHRLRGANQIPRR